MANVPQYLPATILGGYESTTTDNSNFLSLLDEKLSISTANDLFDAKANVLDIFNSSNYAQLTTDGDPYFGEKQTTIKIGGRSGLSQGITAIAIGVDAGQNQGPSSIAIGRQSGKTGQLNRCIAIGAEAGFDAQAESAVAIGYNAGKNSQGPRACAFGENAGNSFQGDSAVAVGRGSGQNSQGDFAVAIGFNAGNVSQGTNSLLLGAKAGVTNSAPNSIIINATGLALNNNQTNDTDSLFIKPIKTKDLSGKEVLMYNRTSGEISSSPLTNIYFSPTLTGTITIPTHGDLVAKLTQTNTTLAAKADQSTTYTKTETDSLLNAKLSTTTFNTTIANYSTTAQMNTALSSKANQSTTYTKTETDTLLNAKLSTATFNTTIANYSTTAQINTALESKANQSTTYSKTETDNLLTAKANTNDPIFSGAITIPTYGSLVDKIADIDLDIQSINNNLIVQENGFDRFFAVGNQVLRLPFLANVVGSNLNAIIYSLLDPIPQTNVLGIFDFSDFGDRSGNYQNFELSADATWEFTNTGTIYDNALNMLTGTAMAFFNVMTMIGGQQASGFDEGYSIVNSGASIENTGYTFRIKYTLASTPTVNTPICGAGVMPTTHPPTGQGTTVTKPCGFHLYISTGRILIFYFIDANGLACSQVTFGTALTLNVQYDITVIIYGTKKLANNNIPVECYRDKVLQTSTYAYLTNGTSETLGVVVGTESSGTRNKFVLIGRTTAVHYLNYLQVWKTELSLADITALYGDDYRDYSVSIVNVTNNYVDFRIANKQTPTTYENVIPNMANYNYLKAVVTYNDQKLISGPVFPNINYNTCVCYYTFADLSDVSGVSSQGLQNINELTNNGVLIENNRAFLTYNTSLTANLSSLYFKNFLYDLKASNGFEINFRINPQAGISETYPIVTDQNAIQLPIHIADGFCIARTASGIIYSTSANLSNAGSGHPNDDNSGIISSYTVVPYFYENNINISKVFTGKDYAYFISTSNRLYFCGSKFSVCANTAVTAAQYTPIEVPFFTNLSITITDIYCGLDMVYFKTSTGLCYVCGSNAQGQYGRNNITGSGQTPVVIAAITAYATTDWKMFPNAATSTIFLLLKTTNKLYAWGNNAIGECGTAVAVGTDVLVPTLCAVVNGLTGDYVVDMAQGLQYTLMLTNLGKMYNNGKNDIFQWMNNTSSATAVKNPVLNAFWPTAVTAVYANAVGTSYAVVGSTFYGSGFNGGKQVDTTTTANKNLMVMFNLSGLDPTISVGYSMLAAKRIAENNFLKYGDGTIISIIGLPSQVVRTKITSLSAGFITLGQSVYKTAYGQVARGCEVILTDGLRLAFALQAGTQNKSKLYRCTTGLIVGQFNDVRIRVNKVGEYIIVKYLINDVLTTAQELDQDTGFSFVKDSAIGFESNLLTIKHPVSIDLYIRNFGIMANYSKPTFLTYYQASSITQTIAQTATNPINKPVIFNTVSISHPFISRSGNGYLISGTGFAQVNISMTAYNILKPTTWTFSINGQQIYTRTFLAALTKFSFVMSYSAELSAGDIIEVMYNSTRSLNIDKASYITITLV